MCDSLKILKREDYQDLGRNFHEYFLSPIISILFSTFWTPYSAHKYQVSGKWDLLPCYHYRNSFVLRQQSFIFQCLWKKSYRWITLLLPPEIWLQRLKITSNCGNSVCYKSRQSFLSVILFLVYLGKQIYFHCSNFMMIVRFLCMIWWEIRLYLKGNLFNFSHFHYRKAEPVKNHQQRQISYYC